MGSVKSHYQRKISVFTYMPSPYQVELFNAIAEEDIFSLSVFYVHWKLEPRIVKHSSIASFWAKAGIKHEYTALDAGKEEHPRAEKAIETSDLTIFNCYRNPFVIELIERCADSGKKWCFWGERPGYSRFGRLVPLNTRIAQQCLTGLGAFYRKWKLYTLYRWNIPIWGIGKWAVEGYRKEFGEKRKYFNLPYFSDLKNFNRIGRETHCDKEKVFLFSGSLIYRKGVDLLAHAFNGLADEFPHVKLYFMGEGKLRPWLEKKLAKHKDRVRFLGFQTWKDLPYHYRQAHFLCAPSRYDGWAVTIPEGLAAGLPVISTDRTGAALEFIVNNKNGWIVPAGNRNALYRAMREATLLSSEEFLERSHNARMSVEHHSLEDGVRRFHDAVMETLGV